VEVEAALNATVASLFNNSTAALTQAMN